MGRLINHFSDKVNTAMKATYGDEDTVLGGLLTKEARLAMERVKRCVLCDACCTPLFRLDLLYFSVFLHCFSYIVVVSLSPAPSHGK